MDDAALEQRLRSGLNTAAADIDTGDAAAGLTSSRRLATRRRRRNIGMATLSCVLVFGAGAVTLRALNTEGSGRLQTAEPPEETTPPTTETPSTTDGAAVEDETAADDPAGSDESRPDSDDLADELAAAPGRPAPLTARATTGDPVTVDAPSGAFSGQHWLLPWQDGFLSIRLEHGQQASPEQGTIPERLLELFPQEVLDLFPDGLPPTLAEAQQTLTDAGLLQVVTDLLAEHPDLSDAILSGETPPPRFTIDFTVDGVAWESVPFDFPGDPSSIHEVVSTGEHLAAFGTQFEAEGPPQYFVATTAGSLEDWSVHALDGPPTDDLPSFMWPGGGSSFAVNEKGWMAALTTDLEVDDDALLRLAGVETADQWGHTVDYTDDGLVVHPPIVLSLEELGLGEEEVHSMHPDTILESAGIELDGSAGYGVSTDQDRVVVQVDWGDNENPDAITIPWEDLDLEAAQIELLREDREQTTEYWSAKWDETPTYTASDRPDWGDLYALGDGYLRSGERVEYSTDGATWEIVDGAPDRLWLMGTMPVENGTVAVMDGRARNRTYLVSDDGRRWQEVVVDGLPHDYYPSDELDSSADIVVQPDDDGWSSEAVVEKDGLRYAFTAESDGNESYSLVDVESGRVVIEESRTPDDWDAGRGWEHNRSDDDHSVVLSDPETGEEILHITVSELNAGWTHSQDSAPGVEPEETFWMIATADGMTWLAEELGTTDGTGDLWMARAARNGDEVLLVGPDGWERYDLDR